MKSQLPYCILGYCDGQLSQALAGYKIKRGGFKIGYEKEVMVFSG